jgi:hypothetical protein
MTEDPRSPPEAQEYLEATKYAGVEKWRTVRSALDSWNRTARMCAIFLTLNVPVEVVAWLIKH